MVVVVVVVAAALGCVLGRILCDTCDTGMFLFFFFGLPCLLVLFDCWNVCWVHWLIVYVFVGRFVGLSFFLAGP